VQVKDLSDLTGLLCFKGSTHNPNLSVYIIRAIIKGMEVRAQWKRSSSNWTNRHLNAPSTSHLLVVADGSPDPLLGMFAQEAALIDQVVDQAMTARETDPLRARSG
jgi:hypothetical protein